MGIRDLDGRYRPQRLGKVRLGRKKETKIKDKIIEIPYATEFFVLDDMPEEIRKEYGEEPTTLRIEFLFNSIEQVFPHYHQYYLRRGLRCMGDGDVVLYRTAGTAEEPVVCVKNAIIAAHIVDEWLDEWAEQYGGVEPVGNGLRCLGFDCPSSEPGKCRPRGRLCFAVQGHEALGYYEMGTGSINAIAGIVGQMELALTIFGHIDAMPWNLHLRPETVLVEGKSRKIYVPWIEIDPTWLQRHFRMRGRHLRATEDSRRADIADLYDDEDLEPLNHDPTPQALLEAAREEEEEEPTSTTAKKVVEEAQAAIEEQLAEMRPEAPPEDEPGDGPKIITEKGNIYERLMEDANHNLKKKTQHYQDVDEIRQAMEAGGVKGRLAHGRYLDYLTIVIDAKEHGK